MLKELCTFLGQKIIYKINKISLCFSQNSIEIVDGRYVLASIKRKVSLEKVCWFRFQYCGLSFVAKSGSQFISRVYRWSDFLDD